MNLKAPCDHGRYEVHLFTDPGPTNQVFQCSGGTLLPADTLVPTGMLVYGEYIPYDIWLEHLPFAGPVDAVVALYALDALAAAQPEQP